MLTLNLFIGMSIPFFLAAAGAHGIEGQRNVTIDDHFGDEITHDVPTYVPFDAWNLVDAHAKPNASLAYKGTWHDTTYHPEHAAKSVSFSFTGVSLYVYCIIANSPPAGSKDFDAFANYTFLLDEEFVGIYAHDVEKKPDFFYNTPVYVNQTMENRLHNFTIVVDSTKGAQVLLLFDYAVYTKIEGLPVNTSTATQTATGLPTSVLPTDAPEAANTSTSPRNAVIIAAATLGALSIFTLFGAFIFYRLQKANKAGHHEARQWRRSMFVIHSESKGCHPALSPLAEDPKVVTMPFSPVYKSWEDVAGQLKGYGADAVEYVGPYHSSAEHPAANFVY